MDKNLETRETNQTANLCAAIVGVAVCTLNGLTLADIIPGMGWRWIAMSCAAIVWVCTAYGMAKRLPKKSVITLMLFHFLIVIAWPFIPNDGMPRVMRFLSTLQVSWLWGVILVISYNFLYKKQIEHEKEDCCR